MSFFNHNSSFQEERFLFPVYPLILFAASSALDSIQRFLAHTLPWLKNLTTHYTAGTNWLPTGDNCNNLAVANDLTRDFCCYEFIGNSKSHNGNSFTKLQGSPGSCFTVREIHVSSSYQLLPSLPVFIFAFIGFGTSRCVALYQNYHAPMDVYMQLHSLYRDTPPVPAKQTIRLCAGKEWYRYPSSFFLPTDQWEFRFIQSEFRAQLPNLYQAPPPSGSKLIPDFMNDQNLEVSWFCRSKFFIESLVSSLETCQYMHFQFVS